MTILRLYVTTYNNSVLHHTSYATRTGTRSINNRESESHSAIVTANVYNPFSVAFPRLKRPTHFIKSHWCQRRHEKPDAWETRKLKI
jgi:hypothetical protein